MTQDGWDWPNGNGDERWPTKPEPTWAEVEQQMVAPFVEAVLRFLSDPTNGKPVG